MIDLYYARPSLFSRPVWLALVEKQLPHRLIPVDITKNRLDSAFLDLNPFGQIPVLVDDDRRIFESAAILDYLEARYPAISLLPSDPAALATVRMAQFVGVNKLIPALVKLLSTEKSSDERQLANRETQQIVGFLGELLGNTSYFGGDNLTLAEICTGSFLHRLPEFDIDLPANLTDWNDRLLSRSSWQEIQLSPAEWESFCRHIRILPKLWQRRRRQQLSP
jgi:glutathione S-transferase